MMAENLTCCHSKISGVSRVLADALELRRDLGDRSYGTAVCEAAAPFPWITWVADDRILPACHSELET